GGLQARTARMSVSTPPLQQLPSKEWRIRRAIVADPGNVYASIDYQAVELRVLAALADVSAMKEAIAKGEDLHGYTAALVYGPDFTKAQRGLMKGVGFGKVYGGGAATLSRQTGAPLDAVKNAIAEYDRVYPEVKRFSKRLQSRAEYGKKEVVTLSGRHLPLDRDRLYAGTNYVVQSTARDLLAQAIVDVFDAGLGDYIRLPIHDELLVEVPEGPAGAEIVQDIARLMESDFQGVPIESDPEIGGWSWGSLYGAADCPPLPPFRSSESPSLSPTSPLLARRNIQEPPYHGSGNPQPAERGTGRRRRRTSRAHNPRVDRCPSRTAP